MGSTIRRSSAPSRSTWTCFNKCVWRPSPPWKKCRMPILDAPSPESFREYFPTVGQMFTLIGTHPMMHAGQFVVVRRQLLASRFCSDCHKGEVE